jgi:hypothetical protein
MPTLFNLKAHRVEVANKGGDLGEFLGNAMVVFHGCPMMIFIKNSNFKIISLTPASVERIETFLESVSRCSLRGNCRGNLC